MCLSFCTDCPSYIVDFEVCDDYLDEPEHEFKFSDDDFVYWTLAQWDVATSTLEL